MTVIATVRDRALPRFGHRVGLGVRLRPATLASRGPLTEAFAGGQGLLVGALLTAGGGLLTRAELIDLIWGGDEDGGPDSADKVLDVWLCRARPKLARLGLRIENVAGGGWRIVAAVTR